MIYSKGFLIRVPFDDDDGVVVFRILDLIFFGPVLWTDRTEDESSTANNRSLPIFRNHL
jgi:hypothetical protein